MPECLIKSLDAIEGALKFIRPAMLAFIPAFFVAIVSNVKKQNTNMPLARLTWEEDEIRNGQEEFRTDFWNPVIEETTVNGCYGFAIWALIESTGIQSAQFLLAFILFFISIILLVFPIVPQTSRLFNTNRIKICSIILIIIALVLLYYVRLHPTSN